jgi:hypothetical protein
MSEPAGKSTSTEGHEGPGWKPTVGAWLVVLALTVATALYFKWKTPDAPLEAASLAFVAFCWFLLTFVIRWIWKRVQRKRDTT